MRPRNSRCSARSYALSRWAVGVASGVFAERMGFAHYFLFTFALGVPAYALLPWVRNASAPAEESHAYLSRPRSQRATASCISRWRCQARSTGASPGSSINRRGCPKSTIRSASAARSVSASSVAGTESRATLPGPRLCEREHHAGAHRHTGRPTPHREPARPIAGTRRKGASEIIVHDDEVDGCLEARCVRRESSRARAARPPTRRPNRRARASTGARWARGGYERAIVS